MSLRHLLTEHLKKLRMNEYGMRTVCTAVIMLGKAYRCKYGCGMRSKLVAQKEKKIYSKLEDVEPIFSVINGLSALS